MNQSIHAACFTGPRPERFAACGIAFADLEEQLRTRLQDEIIRLADQGCTDFYCGMARGVDLLAGEALLSLRRLSPQLKLIAVLPFPKQTYYWEDGWILRYNRVLHQCSAVHTISPVYRTGCFAQRNRYMVDHSDRVIAVTAAGTTGSGTAMTVRYAEQRHKPVIRIDYSWTTSSR